MLMVDIRRSRLFSSTGDVTSSDDGTSSVLSLVDSTSWFNGNIFIGPTNRGPLHPGFQRTEEGTLEAFEWDAQSILHPSHYNTLVILFRRLLDFVSRAHGMYPFQRLIEGFNLFVSMSISLRPFGVTTMVNEQWEEREPTDEELKNVRPDQMRREMRTQKYWAITKSPPRYKRSTSVLEERSLPEGSVTKCKLSIFVSDLMKASMEAHSRDEQLSWSSNLTRTYNDYSKFRDSKKVEDDCSNYISFDEYLYRKISPSYDWHRCNHENDWVKINEWCSAWRRVKISLNVETNSTMPRYEAYS